jgi:hypothetical protein
MWKSTFILCLLTGFSLQAPAPQATTTYGLDSQVPAAPTTAPSGTQSGAAPPRVSSDVTGTTSHGPYSGTATTTGAVSNSPLAQSIIPQGPNPTATYYNKQGILLNPEAAPYTPSGKK